MVDNNKNNGNGHTPDLTQEQIDLMINDIKNNPTDAAFRSEGGFNAAKAMVELHEQLELNALLLDIPNKRFVVAVKYAYYQYKKHNQKERIAALMVQLGMMASIGGRRVQQFSDTIIGERRNHQQEHGGNLLDKLNKFNGDSK
jgi:hypothetical protein